MKRSLIYLVLAMACMSACTKEQQQNNQDVPFQGVYKSFSVAFDNNDTKATLSGPVEKKYSLLWATGDSLNVYVDDNGTHKNVQFKLNTGNGRSTASFISTETLDENAVISNGAIFPYIPNKAQMSNFSVDGSAADGNAYIFLPSSYAYSWAEGRTLMPMLADLSKGTMAKFYHVAGAVKITLNGVPEEANEVTLSVGGKNICGWSSALTASKAGDKDEPATVTSASLANDAYRKTEISFKFAKANSARSAMTFLFPVATTDAAATITVKVKCDGVEIWSITSAKAQPQIGRGDILVMPALTVTPYYAYVMDDIGTRWPGSDKAICVSDVNAWPGIKSTISTTVEGNTYKRFLLPAGAVGASRTLILNNNYNDNADEISLPSTTISAGTHAYYYRTDGLYAVTVSTPSSPQSLTVENRIWACSSVGALRMHAWNTSYDFNNKWDSRPSMTATTAKHQGRTWYYYGSDNSSESANLIFTWDGGQTQNLEDIDIKTGSVYFWVTGTGDSGSGQMWN